jgi:hypothetical protein
MRPFYRPLKRPARCGSAIAGAVLPPGGAWYWHQTLASRMPISQAPGGKPASSPVSTGEVARNALKPLEIPESRL